MGKITNKRQMYELLLAGAFGNTFPYWRSVDEMLERHRGDRFCILYAKDFGGGEFVKNLHVSNAVEEVESYCERNRVGPQDVMLAGWGDPCDRRLQMEVTVGPHAYDHSVQTQVLAYMSISKLDFRSAMRQTYKARGLTAWLEFRAAGGTWLEWQHLLELSRHYDGAVVEATLFSGAAGWSGDRLVVWEVRNY